MRCFKRSTSSEALPDGLWAIDSFKGLTLASKAGDDQRYFLLQGNLEFLTNSPKGRLEDVLSLIGTTEFLMQQSIVPVVAWLEGESAIRIGTASIISCTGYLITAAHVLLDPLEAGYGAARVGREVQHRDDLNFGVFIPFWVHGRGSYLQKAFTFFPFEKMWAWGDWKQSPLLYEDDRWEHLTDVAVCKIPQMPGGQAHQPLNISLNPFTPGEDAYALGYAEMPDIEINPATGRIVDNHFG